MAEEKTECTGAEKQYSLLKNDFFIKKISGKFIVSSVIATLFVFAGSLIDTVLIGFFIGEDGLSAMSLVSPVYLIYYTIGATVGIGASILASRELGRGAVEEYRKIFSCATLVLVVMAVVMTAGGYLLLDPITDALCGEVGGTAKEMARDYLKMYIPGGAFTLLSYIPLYFLKTEGRPKVSSRLFTLSALVNVVFSALLMSPLFNMGVAGASLATSFSMGAVVVVGFIVMMRGKTELKFLKKSFAFARLKNIVIAGLPNGMNNLLSSARILFVNMLLISSGAAHLLPCYTVLRNVTDVLNSVILGISSAIIPLVGVFFGERDYDATRAVMRHAMKIGLRVMVPLVAAASLLSPVLFAVFGVTDAAVIAEGRFALPLAIVGLIAAYANTLYIGQLTAVKREGLATVLVALRLFVLLAATAFPLSRLIGTYGIWSAFSLAEILTLCVFAVIRSAMRKKNAKLDRLLLDTALEHEGDITFSVRNRVEDIVFATEQISSFCEDQGIDMRRSMRVGLALEEILTFLNSHCLSDSPDSYTDVRVCRMDEEVMVRFRYFGKIYDPVTVYHDNEFNEEMQEELLGLKMITKSASLVNFRQTLGANNLMFVF